MIAGPYILVCKVYTIGRKVRTPQDMVLHNVESRQREGKCNRKDTAPPIGGVRVKRCGKSAPVLRVIGEAW